MAQWFATTTRDPADAAKWLELACAAFFRITGLRPQATVRAGGLAAALFPSLARPAGTFCPETDGQRWILGAGAWHYHHNSGEEGLRRMAAAAPREGLGLERWMSQADGLFAVVLPGFSPGELAVCTDRLGAIHAYSAETEGAVLLCTSSLILAALLRREFDPVSVRYFFSYGNLFERRSIFQGISKLPPATVSRFVPDGPSVRETCYWQLSAVNFDSAGQPGGVEPLAHALCDAMEAIGRAYERPILDLTGGFDSRGLLGAMLQSGRRFPTVVNGEDNDPDVIVAGQLAHEFGLEHTHRKRADVSTDELWDLCNRAVALVDGEYDVLYYASTLRTHCENAKVSDATINGSNGEICKGHWWEILMPYVGRHGHFDPRMVAAKRFATREAYPDLLAYSSPDSLVDDLTGVVERATAGMVGMPNTALLDTCYLAMRMQRWYGRIASATSRVWPCLSPFAFRAPMEAALATPPHQRLRHRLSRRLIEYQSPKLAAMALAAGYPALPVRWNTLHRFGPLALEVGEAALRRLKRYLGQPPRPPGPSTYPMARLWELDEVRECLDPRAMRTRGLYRSDTLRRVIERAGCLDAVEAETAGRVLTLELTARLIH